MSSTVLVVDDEVDLLFTIGLSLELAGYRVLKASSGEEALAVVAAESPDAIVLDLRLPGMDGWEVIRRLGETGAFPETPVVLLSAQVDAATAARAVDLGVHAHLAKPFSASDLTRVLTRLVKA
ncbi:MAG TPA: response regulator [Acidimicrobiia bacterium]|nr:response regulator [Acidimicrobiia bacterium]